MRVLVIGGGGREHALCWKLRQSSRVTHLYCAPGNAGTSGIASPVPISAGDLHALVDFALRESIHLTVVGPEAPLVAGLADELTSRGALVFGPTRAAARIEGSKAWARSLCERHGIPVPRSRAFSELAPAVDYLDELAPPFVVKADGLAGGKGVTVASERSQAERALEDCLVHRVFGEAGSTVVLEEHLQGSEVSAMALTDGARILPLALARDHKRALDGDRGPNTGGMGAYSPVPEVGRDEEASIAEGVLRAAVGALRREGIDYRGVLYAGLMLTRDGPKVLEFNCRFGDPETQVVLPRLQSDLLELLLGCAQGELPRERARWKNEAAVGVVLATAGYPGRVEAGSEVHGLEEVDKMESLLAFHSGTAMREGRVVTTGGRVLTVTATGSSRREARTRAYEACSRIGFAGKTYRRDIGEA